MRRLSSIERSTKPAFYPSACRGTDVKGIIHWNTETNGKWSRSFTPYLLSSALQKFLPDPSWKPGFYLLISLIRAGSDPELNPKVKSGDRKTFSSVIFVTHVCFQASWIPGSLALTHKGPFSLHTCPVPLGISSLTSAGLILEVSHLFLLESIQEKLLCTH